MRGCCRHPAWLCPELCGSLLRACAQCSFHLNLPPRLAAPTAPQPSSRTPARLPQLFWGAAINPGLPMTGRRRWDGRAQLAKMTATEPCRSQTAVAPLAMALNQHGCIPCMFVFMFLGPFNSQGPIEPCLGQETWGSAEPGQRAKAGFKAVQAA